MIILFLILIMMILVYFLLGQADARNNGRRRSHKERWAGRRQQYSNAEGQEYDRSRYINDDKGASAGDDV